MKLKTLLLYISLLPGAYSVSAADFPDDIDYGLTFRSHLFNLDERTGLNLSADGNFDFRRGFTMEFDLRINTEKVYGYIFRIMSGNSSLDMVSNVVAGHFNFVLSNGSQVVGNMDINVLSPPVTGWHHVRLDVSGGGINCNIDNVGKRMEGTLSDLRDIDIRFGWNDHSIFYTTDVPPVSIKEIAIREGKETRFHWQLLRHNNDEVYDLIEGRRAEVKDGIWNIDSHCEWTDVFGMGVTSETQQIAYDRLSSRLFVATADSLYVCSLDDGSILSAVKVTGTPVRNAGNQMIYDSAGDRLVCYSMHGDNLAFYDFGASSWTGSFDEPWPPLSGSCRWLDPQTGRLYIFGGYGNHRYNADLIVMDIEKGTRDVLDMSGKIYPRYFGAMCPVKDGNLMVLGGFGNRSGLQEEFPTVLHDIGVIDRNTLECDSLSTFSWSTEPMIFASSMVYDPSEDRIYALAFRNNRFRSSLNLVSCAPGGVMAVHSSPIPFNFHDTDSYADLIFSSDSSKFYAIVLNTRVNGVNALRVYSLAYPPVPASEIMQLPMRQSHLWIYVLASVIILLSGGSVAMVVLRRGKKSSGVAAPVENLPGLEEEKPVFYNISLLGGLKIYDRDGNDATSKFTPMLRSLFLYFLMHTFDSGKAVTADELNDVFWFGMEKSMASNNRNVNMRKLRVVLQEIGDISLSFNNDIITMELGDDIRCDYLETKSLLKSVEEADSLDRAAFARILRLSLRGTLLPGYEYEWLDRYKSGYAELMICVMMKAAKDPAVSSNADYMLRIADCILREDCLDEFAVKTKCHFLYKRGQKGLSRQVYDKWCSDYRKMMDSEPEIQYRSMVERHGL